jgi:hypothetical protein
MITRARRQRGATTLIIAILLLLILAVVSLFTLNVSFFELRTVGNETRQKIIAQAAEAGLNHGFEFVKGNSGNLTIPEATSAAGWFGRWQPCTDATFPCGAEPNPARRALLYKYQHNARPAPLSLIGIGGTELPRFTQVGGFDVNYRVGALLCVMDEVDPAICLNKNDVQNPASSYSGLVSVTLVSEGTLTDDPAARATVKATLATYREFGNAPNVPIIASGGVNIAGGTADIVPNPNAGGTGVALSIWSSNTVDTASGASGGSGAVKTCHLGEFLSNFKGPRGPSEYQGVTICHDCRCDGLKLDKGLISGKYTEGGTGAGRAVGYDILHVYTPAADRDDALPPNTYFPDASKSCGNPNGRCDDVDDDFDDNLFEYIFGIDVVDASGTCVSVTDGKCPDTVYLEERADVVDCATLNAGSSGLLWSRAGTTCALPNGQIGTPLNPVFLVIDGRFSYRANTVFYGVLYKRNAADGDDVSDTNSTAQGGGVFYGSVVIDGPVRVRGSPKFVYNEAVLQNILNSEAFTRFGVVPGSWTDVGVIPE